MIKNPRLQKDRNAYISNITLQSRMGSPPRPGRTGAALLETDFRNRKQSSTFRLQNYRISSSGSSLGRIFSPGSIRGLWESSGSSGRLWESFGRALGVLWGSSGRLWEELCHCPALPLPLPCPATALPCPATALPCHCHCPALPLPCPATALPCPCPCHCRMQGAEVLCVSCCSSKRAAQQGIRDLACKMQRVSSNN